jgi:hypothetical protein
MSTKSPKQLGVSRQLLFALMAHQGLGMWVVLCPPATKKEVGGVTNTRRVHKRGWTNLGFKRGPDFFIDVGGVS